MPWADHEDHFFEKLRVTMIQRGLTARRLSLLIGEGKESYIGSLINGRRRPRIDMLYLISEALDIPLLELISKDWRTKQTTDEADVLQENEKVTQLANCLRHTVTRQPPYHYIHEVWEESGKRLDKMDTILPYIDIFSATEKEPWLICKQIGEITLTSCALESTDTGKYQYEIETSLVETMKTASELYIKLAETMSPNVARRTLQGTFHDGFDHSITYIANILPCIGFDGELCIASFTTPISYMLNKVKVL